MAEDSRESSKARFKSKWNRVFKEKEEHEQTPQHVNSFKLDDDVTAFLKPSTDRAATAGTRPQLAPKIDIAIAKCWPDAHEVARASATTTSYNAAAAASSPNGFTKPRRREGLAVGFVRTAPEVIGEGGDESEEPVSEIRRRKAAMLRSASSRVPSGMAEGQRAMVGPSAAQDPRQARMPNGNEDDFRPQPLQRADTSFNEASPAVQRKQNSPPVDQEEEDPMARRKLSRTPTGLGSHDEHLSHQDLNEQFPVPRIDTRSASEASPPNNDPPIKPSTQQDLPAPSPRDPNSLAARKRELRSSEGMALRRASAMIVDDGDEDENHKRQSLSRGINPPQQHYETLSRPDAESFLPDMPEPRSSTSPLPSGRSPFADPKFMKTDRAPQPPRLSYSQQHSREVTPDFIQAATELPFHSREENDQPSYTRAAPSTHRTRPPIPQVQGPPIPDQHVQPRYDTTPSHVRTVQPLPTHMTVPQQMSSHRNRSPLRDQAAGGDDSPPTQGRPLYSRPNASGNSLNYFAPSPHSFHSRNSSRDGESPRQPMSAGSQQLPSPRFGTQTGSPQNGSPRSSAGAKPSGISPSGQAGDHDYFMGPFKSSQAQSLRPPGGNLSIDDPTSRPGSSASAHSFQRSANHFSGPRPPQSRQPQSRLPSQRSDIGRPSTSDSLNESPQTRQDPHRSQPPASMTKTTATNLRQEDAERPTSGQRSTAVRPMVSPQLSSEGNPAADAAYADFAARVAHMKGVFRLTAEKERPADHCSMRSWLRTATWWYLKGKAGLEAYLQQHRPRSPDGQPRELLTQPHVDLAKTWWILDDILDASNEGDSTDTSSPDDASDAILKQSIAALANHIKSLSLSMSQSQLMPPPSSLIQGQDTSIWLEYPQFHPDAATVLSGATARPQEGITSLSPLDALPLGDMRDTFCYGRFPVEALLNTDQAETDRVVLPCTLSMLRGKHEFLTSIVIASQSELVTIKVGPRNDGERRLSWHDVSWKASSFGMIIRLPHGFDLMVRMHERDFRSLCNLVEYARKVKHSLRTEQDEKLVYESHLAELQYADSSNANAFPPDKIRRCTALVFERTATIAEGGGERKMHRGYRLLLLTDPDHKSLACASHEVCRKSPLFFEYITDAAAHGMAAMVVRIRESSRQCRVLLVFPDVNSRQNFYDVLNGLLVNADETIVGKMNLTSMNIEPATQIEGFTQSAHPALRMIQWQKLGVTNAVSDDPQDLPETVESESLRILARHSTGCITDRLNLSKGELLIRLPCVNSAAIQMLRNPQQDLGMSIDTRHSQPAITDGVSELHQLVRKQPTIRTFTFASQDDLHAFQTAVTGFSVRYDGLATNLSIARRMMFVPIYKNWGASNVRVQVVSHSPVVQILAFMEGFSHADALCFQVKASDTFETIKGDGKGKKWAVKLVDAKFSLPHIPEREKEKQDNKQDKNDKDKDKERTVSLSPEEREAKVRGRYVNLEGLEYAEEHDDITIGFETMEERDKFAQALPAAATVGRGLTLKRRI